MIKIENVTKKFGTGALGLSGVSIEIEKGEFVFLVGPTGSGKTTFLRLLIKDVIPTEGNVFVDEFDLLKLPKSKLSILRKKIGVVFQDLKLLADRTVFENVVLPLEVAGMSKEKSKPIVEDILGKVGLLEHINKFPIQLSGGELQRTAIARALVLSPEIFLADEPTGNLDPATGWEIVKILSDINKNGTTVIMATHNADIVKNMHKRVVHINEGKVLTDDRAPDKENTDTKHHIHKKAKEKEDEE